MLEPIHISIFDVARSGDGIALQCTWTWGDADPVELHVLTGDWPKRADDVRALVTAWVLDYAEDEQELAPLRDELMQQGWTFTFDSEEDPFGGPERAKRHRLLEQSAGAISRVP